MSRRIQGGVSPQLNPNVNTSSSSMASQAEQVPRVGDQIVNALFGRQQPPLLDPDEFPELAAMISMLNRFRKKLA
ncbi:MAG: hypothetical protein AAFQ82_08140, partial [Myxococcota bacterium]